MCQCSAVCTRAGVRLVDWMKERYVERDEAYHGVLALLQDGEGDGNSI